MRNWLYGERVVVVLIVQETPNWPNWLALPRSNGGSCIDPIITAPNRAQSMATGVARTIGVPASHSMLESRPVPVLRVYSHSMPYVVMCNVV